MQQQQQGGVQDWGPLQQGPGGWTAAPSRELPGWQLCPGVAIQRQQQVQASSCQPSVLVLLAPLQAAAGCLVVRAAQGPDGGSSRWQGAAAACQRAFTLQQASAGCWERAASSSTPGCCLKALHSRRRPWGHARQLCSRAGLVLLLAQGPGQLQPQAALLLAGRSWCSEHSAATSRSRCGGLIVGSSFSS